MHNSIILGSNYTRGGLLILVCFFLGGGGGEGGEGGDYDITLYEGGRKMGVVYWLAPGGYVTAVESICRCPRVSNPLDTL